mmetsp:Transcript_26941/g.41272  ORF Transcript_26941/g.41272 Transcript_26941/m.41272 type:complete len:908 (-) Transcript_26941:238-2961(-)
MDSYDPEAPQDAYVTAEVSPMPPNMNYGTSMDNPSGQFGMDDSDDDSDDETGLGNTKLYAIIEEAVPRPEDNRNLSISEMGRRNELIETTWDRVRKWFRSHVDEEARAAAASVRGQADATPIHMVCKLSDPPPDIVQLLIDSAPETAGWADSHGWHPLHHACANGASTEVLHILIDAYPEGKIKQDNQSRTPLHFYATRRAANTNVMAQNVEVLADSGAAELPDRGGMLPMHYACAYGTNPAVLEVLANAYSDSLVSKENKGRTPMHLAMVNAHRAASPGVIRFLLENSDSSAVNIRDSDGYLPLHLLAAGLKGARKDDEDDQRSNVSECLKMYLDAKPIASADFLTALQDLPDWLQDVAVITPHVRNLLNEKIVQRFHTMILMTDGFMLLILIACFERATKFDLERRYWLNAEPNLPPNTNCTDLNATLITNITLVTQCDKYNFDSNTTTPTGCHIMLFIGAMYFFARELIQIISLISLNSFGSWFTDSTNWLDMTVIILVFYYTLLMTTQNPGLMESENAFKYGCACTKAVLMFAVIYFLKSTMVEFAVFVDGVFYVLVRLTAFLIAVLIVLLAFAEMFFIIYKDKEGICVTHTGEEDFTLNAFGGNYTYERESECDFPHCEFLFSFLKVYTMMMGEIGNETRYQDETVAQVLYLAYAFVVVILLSNVLIAIVTDSYEVIQNDRAAIVFWSNRLDFVAEMDAISYGFKERVRCFKKKGDGSGGAPGAPMHVQELPDGDPITDGDHDDKHNQKELLRELWSQLMMLFDPNLSDDYELNPGHLEFWVYATFRIVAILFVIPVWLIIGLATCGWLWPPQVREYLFIQKTTTITRADIEKAKLEQLKTVQTDLKAFKSEIEEEMAEDRDQVARLKMEIETSQTEITSDLQQVKELMTTLLDMGRTRASR